jgi:hypothetical protein
MGSQKGGVAKIKAHPWFRGFDWEALEVWHCCGRILRRSSRQSRNVWC